MVSNSTVRLFSVLLAALLLCFVAGCGSSSDSNNDQENTQVEVIDNNDTDSNSDDNNADVSKFVGVWLIEKEGTYSYWIFNEDGTFVKKRADEPRDGVTHFSGTYSVDGGFLTGKFVNPGVGNGEIEGTVNVDRVFLMDFIEYWHTPRKVVQCVGVRQ